MKAPYAVSLKIGGSFLVNDYSILYFKYKSMWDKGSSADILIHDRDTQLQLALANMNGDPTPKIEFLLEWTPSAREGSKYKNKGTLHTLYILRAGMVTTPLGLAIRIKAVDAGSILLREKTLSYSANGVKASKFIKDLCLQVGINSTIPETGDVAFNHQALQAKPIDHIRYELDRVLSANGNPISLQFDDGEKQALMGYEELYSQPTQALDTISGGQYSWGGPSEANKGVVSGYNTTAYHFEMDQDFRPALWGHQVSMNHLTNRGEQVIGEIKSKLSMDLGIQGSVFSNSVSRLHLPSGSVDNPTNDQYFARSVMVNTVFQSEMCATHGYAIIDPDFKAFDTVGILNRKHLIIGITGGKTDSITGNALVPKNSVIMGYEHRLNRESGVTKVFLRRGA